MELTTIEIQEAIETCMQDNETINIYIEKKGGNINTNYSINGKSQSTDSLYFALKEIIETICTR
jgi:hypothetical protein